MKNAVFYHAGCPFFLAAEDMVVKAVDPSQYNLEVVHFAQSPDRIGGAETAGVKSVPALVLDNEVFHINFGASMADVKAS